MEKANKVKRLADPCTGKEIWKLTDEPAVNIRHLYHNVDAFSADGRYVAFGVNQQEVAETPIEPQVAVFDLAEQRERGRHPGSNPVWDPTRPQLAFDCDGTVCAWDIESDTVRKIADLEGVRMGSVERTGQWALVSYEFGVEPSRIDRVALDGSGTVETIFEVGSDGLVSSPRANPAHDVCHVRYYGPKPGVPVTGYRDKRPRGDLHARYMMIMGTDGSNPHQVSAHDEWAHHNWSGDGEWYMLGGSWKRWNAPAEEPWQMWSPLPAGLNHQGHCGRDGRLIVGDFANYFTYIFNLQTHELTLMNAAMSSAVPYAKNADPHPIGSPDGTKYVFDSMYDMANAPVTRLAVAVGATDDELIVESTAGFPDSGHLVVGHVACGPEVIAYGAKQGNRFLQCRRGSPPAVSDDTPYKNQNPGATPTRFGRGVPVIAYHGLNLAPGKRREPDVHIQIVRPPEHPRAIRAVRGGDGVLVSWQAPVNCREICEYHIWRDETLDATTRTATESTESTEESGLDRTLLHDSVSSVTSVAGLAWSDIGKVPASQTKFQDPDAPAGPLRYAVSSAEHCGLTSAKSATAVVASQDGSGLPPQILLPIGDAEPVISTYANPETVLIESFDELAHNCRAVVMQHGASNMRLVFEMPRNAAGYVEVHARSTDAAAHLKLGIGDDRFETFVDQPEYGWIPASLDEEARPAAVALKEGANELTLGAPEARLHLDCVRVMIQDAEGDRS